MKRKWLVAAQVAFMVVVLAVIAAFGTPIMDASESLTNALLRWGQDCLNSRFIGVALLVIVITAFVSLGVIADARDKRSHNG